MNLLIFFTWASLFSYKNYIVGCAQRNQNKYSAFIYEIPSRDIHFDGIKNVSRLTFCPASTEREKEINDRVSITRHSLFLRTIHGPQDNVTENICEKPFKPAMVYNSESHQYEIGYELYYEEGSFRWEDGAYFWRNYLHEKSEKYQFGKDNNFHVYRSVNNRFEAINNDEKKEFLLTNGSSKWIFRWTPVIDVISSGDNRQLIGLWTDFDCLNPPDDALRSKCADYGLPDWDMKIYISSKVDHNPRKSKNRALPSMKKLKPWNGQLYGSLRLSQIIPLWYFGKSWAKKASCSHMNMIPVWKTIADGQLRIVDLYIIALQRQIRFNIEDWYVTRIHFGTRGELTYRNESGTGSNQNQGIYSSPNNVQSGHILPVPKIIYRVIIAENGIRNAECTAIAIVVIHNDPNPVPDSDRICDESEELEGWEAITNDDPRTGITYVCPFSVTYVAHEKLGFQIEIDARMIPLNLNMMLDIDIEGSCVGYLDATEHINPEFEKLLNSTADV